jgi:endonuclease-3
MTKKERAAMIVAALEREYPQPAPGLSYSEASAWQLLVAVRLAAQCTDVRVNMVTPALFARYPTPWALADATEEDIEAMIHTCGLGASKARDIKGCMRMLAEEHGGRVPGTMDELLKLPGVGRKSANLVLGDIYGLPAIVCDTHCIRISGRLGLVSTKNPAVAEKQLRAVIAPEKGNDFCHRLVLHGRAVCTARGCDCGRCCLMDFCPGRREAGTAKGA